MAKIIQIELPSNTPDETASALFESVEAVTRLCLAGLNGIEAQVRTGNLYTSL